MNMICGIDFSSQAIIGAFPIHRICSVSESASTELITVQQGYICQFWVFEQSNSDPPNWKQNTNEVSGLYM